MFSTKESQAAIVEATRALGYSKLRSNQDRVVAADNPFRSPRLVSLGLSAGSSLPRLYLTLSNFSTSRTRSRGKPSQGTRCQDSPEISRLLLDLVRYRRWTSLDYGSPTFHCACAIVERRENMT